MNEQTIEKLLHRTPPVVTPARLLERLQADIELLRTAPDAARVARRAPFRRWFPALGFALWFLGCLVVFGIQASRIAELKRANHDRHATTAALQKVPDEQTRAAQFAMEIQQLRRDAADAQRLRAEVEQLRRQAQELATLRAQNEQFKQELRMNGAVSGPEKDFFAVAAERAVRTDCIQHLKQVCLAARIWANKSRGNSMPADFDSFRPYLAPDHGGEKLLFCPGDRRTHYEMLSPGASVAEPQIVFLRCPIHENAGMVDGSAQMLNPGLIVQRDGKWVIERPKDQ